MADSTDKITDTWGQSHGNWNVKIELAPDATDTPDNPETEVKGIEEAYSKMVEEILDKDSKQESKAPSNKAKAEPEPEPSHSTAWDMITRTVEEINTHPWEIGSLTTVAEAYDNSTGEAVETAFTFRGATFSAGREEQGSNRISFAHWRPGTRPEDLASHEAYDRTTSSNHFNAEYRETDPSASWNFTKGVRNLNKTLEAMQAGTWEELSAISGSRAPLPQDEQIAGAMADRIMQGMEAKEAGEGTK